MMNIKSNQIRGTLDGPSAGFKRVPTRLGSKGRKGFRHLAKGEARPFQENLPSRDVFVSTANVVCVDGNRALLRDAASRAD